MSGATARGIVARLAVLAVTTLLVSGSWLVVVDAWPASSRPYVGGSTDNTVLDLALGYNGFGRVDGESQGGTGGGRAPANVPGFRGGVAPPPAAVGGGFAGPGGIFGGLPGVFRMFDDANGGQIGWLLPLALGVGFVALWRWRADPLRRAASVLFLGWVLVYGVVFSYAQGIFHSYYTSAMAPGVAALVGIGAVAIADMLRRNVRWLAVAIALTGMTVWAELVIAGRTPEFYGWVRPLMLLVTFAGIADPGRQGAWPTSRTAGRSAHSRGTVAPTGGMVDQRDGKCVAQHHSPAGRATGGRVWRTFGSQCV